MLTASAAYQAALALGWLFVGPLPGETPTGYDLALGVALIALLGGAALCTVYAARGRRRAPPAAALGIGPAAVAFVVARFYSFDPYYAPTLRRMSEDGLVADAWVYTLVALGLLGGILVRARPRIGLGLTAAVLRLSAPTALAAGLGH